MVDPVTYDTINVALSVISIACAVIAIVCAFIATFYAHRALRRLCLWDGQ